MLFSIIIVNYQTRELTAASLRSIFAHCQKEDFEIIVVDNNSSDNSAEFLEKEFGAKIKLLKNSQNYGFAKANNQGAREATGRYLFFLNSDTWLTADILKPMEKLFSKNENIGILSPRLLLKDGSPQTGVWGEFPALKKLIFKNRWAKKKSLAADQPFATDWVSGCALIIRHDLFKKIGAWDENFFLYLEDVDLCYRARQENKQVMVNPQTSLIHLNGQSLKQLNDRRRRYYQAQNYYFRKHYGLAAMIAMKIIRWPYKFWVLKK